MAAASSSLTAVVQDTAAAPANQGQTAAQAPAEAAADEQTQTQPTNLPQGQAGPPQGQTGQGTEQIDVITAPINFTEAQATFPPLQAVVNQPAAGAPANTAASSQAAQPPSALTMQIQALQVALQTVEIPPGSQQLDGSSAPPPAGTSLNVTV